MYCNSSDGARTKRYLFTDFNSGIPTGWTQSTQATDGGFLSGSASTLSSSYFTITDPGSNFVATNDDGCNCNKADEYLITDTIDLSNYSVMHATFKSFYFGATYSGCLLYTSPSPRDGLLSRMPSSA